ncbi:MAG: TIGR02679 family protein [Solirubrobacteraceae bacterium]
MSPETLTYLSRPTLRRLLFAARERFERNSGPYGKLVLTALSPDETHALNGLLAPQRAFAPGGDAQVKLSRLDARLRDACFGVSLEQALIAVDGPLGNRRAARDAAAAARQAAWARVLAHPQAQRAELAPWLEHARRRFGATTHERAAVVLQALDVLTALPADGQPLAALAAARAGGDAHALDRSRPLGRLVAAALFALEGARPREPMSADAWRALWARVGVSCDELSCTVLTLGLRPHRVARGYLAGRLRAAARAGRPIVLTLAELRTEPPHLAGERLFVCENPSIVAAACNELGPRCPPLLCTAGSPNAAVTAILDAAESANMEILVHADGDHAGAAITARVLKRPRARLWRDGKPSTGVHEEAVLDELLVDLDSGWIGQGRLVAS